ncbi:MAG TPA: FAD-dependent oxidoreductase [Anaerolineae bacterium]|nr:FAD-dependent oxidoreductase [Anaerolineae bacterium]
MSEEKKKRGVLVVGAGIAGMAAAMHLSELGEEVALLETAPTIGGSMHLLDHTFPTDSCGLCLMLPQQPSYCPTLECERRAGMRLLAYSELVGLEGEPDGYRATVRHKPRYVSEECDGCGRCAEVCPVARPHDHEGWLAPVKAVYRPAGLRAVPDTWVIDMAYCTRCGKCVSACPRGAIDLDAQAEEEEVEVGAVLLTPGYKAFDARRKGEFGYGAYPNVVTSLEFERLVSLAGSSSGRLRRPSARGPLRKVAFIQCVGSRDERAGAGYCSSACCMYTAKQVKLAKKAEPGLEVTVFYMDLRAAGKGYEAYLDEVQAMPGVRYLRAMPSSVHQLQRSKKLLLAYIGPDGKPVEEEFDLVVLAVGLAAPEGVQAAARQAGVALDGYGFACTSGYEPLRTGQEGIFVAGGFREPKEVPETVAEATAAAAEVAAYLRGRRQDSDRPSPHPLPKRDSAVAARALWEEEPRVGVFLCATDGSLAAEEVLSFARGLPGVAVARQIECAAAVAAEIEAATLNRVVVAGGNGRLDESEYDAAMRQAGLDERLLRRVRLLEQVVYPHAGGGPALTAKAQSLIGMAVASLSAMQGLEALPVGGSEMGTHAPRALVVGGGAAGMSAALGLAGLGIEVELVEREAELGGQWRSIRHQADGSDAQTALEAMRERVAAEKRVHVHLGSRVRSVEGSAGAYRSAIVREGEEQEAEHGVVVVATGGRPARTSEYLYGQHPGVLTQRELEERPTTADLKSVVMIQCAGSREEPRSYCSRICCTQAVKNALRLKATNPGTRVYILYRDVRTFGFREEYYRAAREAGVVFLRYDLPGKPQVTGRGERLQVSLREPVTGQELTLEADAVVLSVGIEAEGEEDLARQLGVSVDRWGFFEEEHAKMKPLDLGKGVYVAGLAHSARFLDEAIVQGQAAAMRAAAWLGQAAVRERASSVWVDERLCSFCGLCVDSCPYEARVMDYDRRVAVVDYGLCQGCGVCAVVCPNKATKQKGFEQRQLMSEVDWALV